jgi:hypothetical protein
MFVESPKHSIDFFVDVSSVTVGQQWLIQRTGMMVNI